MKEMYRSNTSLDSTTGFDKRRRVDVTSRRVSARFAILPPLLAAAIMLTLGLWLRWPNLGYRGPPKQGAYNTYAFNHFIYSDIVSLFFRDELIRHPRPYFDYQFEYPVGTGLLVYLLNTAPQLRPYFLATSLFMAVSGLLTVWLVPRFPHGRVWLLALSPALAFYVNLNWDMWAALLTALALLCFVRERDGWGAGLLAAAVWTKFFPIVIVPLIVAERARGRRWRDIARMGSIFTLVSAVMNVPLLISRPRAWLYFFEMNRMRSREVNLWNFFDRLRLSTAQITNLSLLLLGAGLAVLAWAVWRGRPGACLPATCAAFAWFFFVNKVYSPQYSLWVVVLLAVAGAAPAVAVAWSAADLLYFAASFLILGLVQFGRRTTDWFYNHGLIPAMALREAMLLVVIGWCLWRIYQDATAPRPSSDRAEEMQLAPDLEVVKSG